MDEVAEIGLNIEMEILCFSIYTSSKHTCYLRERELQSNACN